MIPKVIHYCWFGGNPLPEKEQHCIESWKKMCPDWEIKRWDESNYDIVKNKYMYQAYQAKKWGFVPDFGRLDIIFENGGVYLDTDVELIKPLDDLLDLDGFMCFEDGKYVNPGLCIGAVKKHPMIGELMHIYDNLAFQNENGELDLTPSPVMNTDMLIQFGLVRNNQLQTVNGLTIFPTEYFCPKDYNTGKLNITANTRGIHHFSATWLSEKDNYYRDLKYKLIAKFGQAIGTKLSRIIDFPHRVHVKVQKLGFVDTIHFALGKLGIRLK